MMDRLQKKCVLSSLLLHGSLCLIFLIASAFTREQPQPQVVTLVDLNGILTDGASSGGGPGQPSNDKKPGPAQPAPEPMSQPVQPTPPPVREEPVPPKPTPKPTIQEPEKVDKPEKDIPDEGDYVVKSKKKPVRKKMNLDLSSAVDLSDVKKEREAEERKKQEAEEKAQERAAQKAYEKRRDAINGVRSAISGTGKALSSTVGRTGSAGVVVDLGGTGNGGGGGGGGGGDGPAMSNYRDYISTVYYEAWHPETITGHPVTVVEVIISRNGTIKSSTITRASGNSGMDKSVQRALDRVSRSGVRPFPSESTDSQRTYRIKFDPETKEYL